MKPGLLSILLLFVTLIACNQAEKKQASNAADTTAATDSASIQLAKLNNEITANPGNAATLHERAKLLISLKRYAEALTDMEKALSIDSTKAPYFLTMADISFAANHTFDAKKHLEKAIAIDPDNTDAVMKLAELNLIVRQYSASVALLNKVLEKDKKNTTAWLMRGINYKENGDTTRAISDFRSAIEADPNFYDAYMQLGILYQTKNDPLAEGYFTNAIHIKPESEEALYGRGLWYQDHNQLNKAIEDYTTIVIRNPKNRNAHFNLGYIHQIYLKVYPEAIKHYSNALLADPKYAEAYYNRGLCKEFTGDLEGAKADYKSALLIRPVYPPAEEGLKRLK